MSRKVQLALLLLGLIALSGLTTIVRAQDADEDDIADDAAADEPEDDAGATETEEEESDDERTAFGSHQDIETKFIFAEFPDRRLGIGEDSHLLIHLTNRGNKEFNVTHVGAYLHSPFDYNLYKQNFSVAQVRGANLGPKGQISVDYRFKPDVSHDPSEYWFSAFIVYNSSSGDQYVSTVYNGTVELIETKTPADVKRFFTIVLTVAGGALAFILYTRVNQAGGSSPSAAASGSTVERGTREMSSERLYVPAAKAKAVKRKSKSPGTKKKKSKAA